MTHTLLNLYRTSKGFVLRGWRLCIHIRTCMVWVFSEGRGRACVWCGHEEIQSVIPVLLLSHSVPQDPSAMGSENGYQVSMIGKMRLQQTGKLSLPAPHGRNNPTAYFDLKTFYISNVIKKFQPV